MILVQRNTALIVVDAQCGFTTICPQELPVAGGLEIVPNVNRLLDRDWNIIFATQDWHPVDHCSFLGNRDNLYPIHCVANSRGAEFLPGLATDRFHAIWRKGYERDREAYAVTAQHPGFINALRASAIETVIVCGIATNICCFFTARDLANAGFKVIMAEDASAGIDVPVANLFQAKAKEEGIAMGMKYLKVEEILADLK